MKTTRACYLYEVVFSKFDHRTLKLVGRFSTSKEAEEVAEERFADTKIKYVIEFVKEDK